MRERDAFSNCHPAVGFFYFALVLVFTMFCMEPACLIASLCAAGAYGLYLNGGKSLLSRLAFFLPMALFAGLVNPLFNYRGKTVLLTFPWGRPLTLESLLYGGLTGLLLAATLLWFTCFHRVMTTDKFLFLFGRFSPSLALLISMSLGFVPRFGIRLQSIREAQKSLGYETGAKKLSQKIKHAVSLLSILVTCVLEDAVETADSMKSRGYGLAGRTSYSMYRFTARDGLLLGWFLACAVYLIRGWAAGGFFWNCYPEIESAPVTWYTVSLRAAYLLLCFTPLLLDVEEDRRWAAARNSVGEGGERP